MKILNLFFLFFTTLLLSGCTDYYSVFETKLHTLDASSLGDKYFYEVESLQWIQENYDDYASYKSRCDSFFIHSFTKSGFEYIQATDSLFFPDLKDESLFLGTFLYYLLPINSVVEENEIRVNLFVREYWADEDYYGLWVVFINGDIITNFLILKRSEFTEMADKWHRVIEILNEIKIKRII